MRSRKTINHRATIEAIEWRGVPSKPRDALAMSVWVLKATVRPPISVKQFNQVAKQVTPPKRDDLLLWRVMPVGFAAPGVPSQRVGGIEVWYTVTRNPAPNNSEVDAFHSTRLLQTAGAQLVQAVTELKTAPVQVIHSQSQALT